MGYYCYPCNRPFVNEHSYNQHINNSAAHQDESSSSSEEEEPEFECDGCNSFFHTERTRDKHHAVAHADRFCVPCERMFMNAHNLMQHMHSKIHSSLKCPFCKSDYATASAVTIHLESGTCTSGLTRQKINELVRILDRGNVITRPMITMPGYDCVETLATFRAWNGYGYECYLCNRVFDALNSLNQHLKSPAHEESMYRCPKTSCGKHFKLLSGLVQHVESESCGVMRFTQVQAQAQKGIQNMVGRMIRG